ncbi:M16 family metallopeptidase [Novispirillum itersonii]|uniref:M16 family metallopeptidase n=1 Tax=Novispirillum itersonii TaxID=189 RepID=UPI00036BF184|nr:pitrilysin family protein [Novispirillum itersonii]
MMTISLPRTVGTVSVRVAALVSALVVAAVLSAPARAVEAQRVISPGGIEAWLVEDHSVPVLSVSIGFKAGGSAYDPAGKEGLATLVSGMLDEGAGDFDSFAFRTRLENTAIHLSFSASANSLTGTLKTVSDHRMQAFELLRLALTKPRFDAEPLDRVRHQILASLAEEAEDPQALAGEALDRLMFPGHPYARPAQGTPKSVTALTAADLRGFVRTRLALDGLKVGVSGDITPAELGQMLDKTFGELPKTANVPPLPAVAIPQQGGIAVIDRDLPQAVATFAQPGLERADPDFYPAYVVNYILGGGGFSSRLMTEVREKRGLAYGVYAYFQDLEGAPLIIGGVSTNAARVGESLSVIAAEWQKMAESGPTAEELEAAKSYLIGSWPLRFTSTGAVASMLMSMQLDGYPLDHLQTRNAKVAAVTLEDARRAARRLLQADQLKTVVVGRPKGVTATLTVPN